MPKQKRQIPISAKLKKLPPRKPKNSEQRSREYLTDTEIERLRKAAKAVMGCAMMASPHYVPSRITCK